MLCINILYPLSYNEDGEVELHLLVANHDELFCASGGNSKNLNNNNKSLAPLPGTL